MSVLQIECEPKRFIRQNTIDQAGKLYYFRSEIMQKYHDRMLILLILFYPLFYLGIGGKYPWILLGENGIAIGMSFFFSFTILFIMSIILIKIELIKQNRLKNIVWLNVILAILFVTFYDFIQYKHFARFGYQSPFYIYVLNSAMLFTLFAMRKILYNKNKALMLLLSIFVIVHYGLSIHYFPLTIARSDMLVAIRLSLEHFLQHSDPYIKISQDVGIPPYLPMTILSFFPSVVFNYDPRVIALLLMGILILLIFIKFEKLTYYSQWGIILVLINPYWIMRHDLYFQLFLIEIVLVFLYFPSLNVFWRSIILGAFLATLQFAWILFPFIIFAYSNNYRQLLQQLLISILVGTIIVYSFVEPYFSSFIHAAFLHKEYLGRYGSDITFGLSPIFYFAKSQLSLFVAQIIGCIVLVSYSVVQYLFYGNRDKNFYLISSVVCYFYFMITNYFIETYLLIPVILVLALQLQAHEQSITYP